MKTPEEAMDLIENMVVSDIAILRDRAHIPTKKSLLELTSQDALLAQNKLLSKKLEALTETLSKLPTQLHFVQSVVELMTLDVVSLVKNQLFMKSNTWGISPEILLMQEDLPDSKMASNINNIDNGRTTLVINPIETRMDSSIGLSSKGLVSMSIPRSWKRL